MSKLASIQTRWKSFWKYISTPSYTEEQVWEYLRQRQQEADRMNFEKAYLEIEKRLQGKFQKTTKQIEVLREEINELRRK